MNSQAAFGIVAVFYAVANLASMGIELDLRETIKSLRSVRVLGLTLGWSWLVGPAFAVLLTKILPMAEPYATGLLIFSLAPTAPALPLFIRKARADMSLAAAIMPLAVVSTVVLMPLLAPLLIPGLTFSSWAIGKPLLLTVLLPLVVGVAIKVYAARVADKIFPTVKKIAGISTLLLLEFRCVPSLAGTPQRAGQFWYRGPSPVYPRNGAGVLQPRFRPESGPAQCHGAWRYARAMAVPCWWQSLPFRASIRT